MFGIKMEIRPRSADLYVLYIFGFIFNDRSKAPKIKNKTIGDENQHMKVYRNNNQSRLFEKPSAKIGQIRGPL
ncbi:hypothetical protein CHH92_13210 [Bacillus sonorensis]|uniref:Uncharacterized protein n=2 Tax=Bacillus sonorensis TaxID=119858 RepID=M5PDI6_9BACI|nr:hypothetical protein S101395_02056 [Bacillus sonorensis]EME74750.1 hypothetical protein BSONL12_07152 [Bacillus sonorensis L12]MBG9915611.1 hypothetical protein [Bacillus sonorensis]PAD59725.1 hypothetical protein CHH92_13210 [Bacillus sonorensis]RHJ06033.1 hypothetical protein DW143_22085 [Bacillus sonorensis]